MYISNNPNNELEQSIVQVPDLVQIPEEIHEMAQKFQEAMMMYTCAIREVKTKLEVLNDEAEKHCGKVKKARTSAYT